MRVLFFLQESTTPYARPFFESLLKTEHISILTQCDFTSTMLFVCVVKKNSQFKCLGFLLKVLSKNPGSLLSGKPKYVSLVVSEANTCKVVHDNIKLPWEKK